MKVRKAIAGLGIMLLTVVAGANLAAMNDVSASPSSITVAGKKGGSGDWWP